MVSGQRGEIIHPGFPGRAIFTVLSYEASSWSSVSSIVLFNVILEKARLMVEWLKLGIPNFLPAIIADFLIVTPVRCKATAKR